MWITIKKEGSDRNRIKRFLSYMGKCFIRCRVEIGTAFIKRVTINAL